MAGHLYCPNKLVSRILSLRRKVGAMIIYLRSLLPTTSSSRLYLGLHQVEFTTGTLSPEAE